MGMMRRCSLAIVAVSMLLSGCEWLESILPGGKKPPLPGERVAVMLLERKLDADPRIADLQVVLPRPYTNAAWPQPGGSPSHTLHHLALGATPKEAWTVDIGAGSEKERALLSTPVVADGRVYTMDVEYRITALNLKGGGEIWQYEPNVPDEDEDTFGGGLAYDNGRLYVTTGFGDVMALDAKSGTLVWREKAAGPIRSAPTATGGRVYVITIDNQLTVLDATTGRKQWGHTAISESAGLLGGSSVAVSGSTVIVPYSSGELFAMRAENGRVVWSDNLTAVRRVDAMANLAHIRGNPVIDRGVVFAISHSGRLVAIDQRSGARVWERNIGGVDTPWVAGDFVYVLSNENEVFCLTRTGGRIRWVQSLPRFENPKKKKDPIRWSGPVLAGDRLVLASSKGEVVTISPYSGEFLGKLELPDDVFLPPVVAADTLFFLTEDAELIAYR
jgi:outer membrane protein assembly factor BamB